MFEYCMWYICFALQIVLIETPNGHILLWTYSLGPHEQVAMMTKVFILSAWKTIRVINNQTLGNIEMMASGRQDKTKDLYICSLFSTDDKKYVPSG